MYADWGLFVVADGMGGHQGGEVAANLAVRAVAKAERGSVSDLRNAVVEANRLVHETAIAQPELHGMGTTLTALAVDQHGEGHQFVVLNVGDSRVTATEITNLNNSPKTIVTWLNWSGGARSTMRLLLCTRTETC